MLKQGNFFFFFWTQNLHLPRLPVIVAMLKDITKGRHAFTIKFFFSFSFPFVLNSLHLLQVINISFLRTMYIF